MRHQKNALITGITGQNGFCLAKFLREKGYIVHGIKCRASSFNNQRVDHICQDPHVTNTHFKLHHGDLSDTSNLVRIVQEMRSDEIDNLSAQSHVAGSFKSDEYIVDVNGMGHPAHSGSYPHLGSGKETPLPPCQHLKTDGP